MENLQFGNLSQESYSYKAKVKRVIDGDTVDVEYQDRVYRIRLLGIDTPESNQPGGAVATHFLKMLIENTNVLVSVFDEGIHRRQLGVIYDEHMKDINQEIVKNGYAWAYGDNIKAKEYEEHQEKARKERLGIWENRFPIEPSVWRKEKMTMTEKQKVREMRIEKYLEEKRKKNSIYIKRKIKASL